MYDSIDLTSAKNFKWFHQTMMQGGCSFALKDLSSSSTKPMTNWLNSSAQRVMRSLWIVCGLNKPLLECIFDLVITTNPSSGIVGLRNCIWFQNLML